MIFQEGEQEYAATGKWKEPKMAPQQMEKLLNHDSGTEKWDDIGAERHQRHQRRFAARIGHRVLVSSPPSAMLHSAREDQNTQSKDGE